MGTPNNKLVLFVLFFCLFLLTLHLHHISGCNIGKGCLLTDAASHDIIQSRKVLYVLDGKKLVFNMHGVKRENELRRVPSGPDPLHHNGSGPKKPKTSP